MAEMIQPAMVPKVKLYTGEEIPCVGMGTFGSDRFTPEQVSNAQTEIYPISNNYIISLFSNYFSN